MRLIIWFLLGIIILEGLNHSYLWKNIAYAGTLSSYSSTATLVNADIIPIVISSGDTNKNINWYSLKQIISSGLNWTNIKVIGTQYGDHSGINWQSFGA